MSRAGTATGAYAVIAVAHPVSLAAGLTCLEWLTKFLLVPTLAAWLLLRRGPDLVVAALVPVPVPARAACCCSSPTG